MVALSASGQGVGSAPQTDVPSQGETQAVPPLIAAPPIPSARPIPYKIQPTPVAPRPNNPGHPGPGDEGCPSTSVFDEAARISAGDFLEMQRVRCSVQYASCPLYTVRIYGDGRLVWHGEKDVSSVGDAASSIDAGEARAILAKAVRWDFGRACDDYVGRWGDGPTSVMTLKIGGQVKTVHEVEPSNAPGGLYWLRRRIDLLDPVDYFLQWSNVPNRWRLKPADQATQVDTASAADRAARNADLAANSQVIFGGRAIIDYNYGLPDVGTTEEDRKKSWVVGTFESYRVYGVDGGNEGLYTEIHFKVDRVICGPADSTVATGSTVDVYDPGGRLRTVDGVVHSSNLWPERYSVAPGRTYLLELTPLAGGLFRGGGWDVTDGVVRVGSVVDEVKAEEGKSELVGKTLSDAVGYVQEKLGRQ